MSQFLYLYRATPTAPASPQEMQERMKSWMTWMKDLEAKGHIVDRGQPLEMTGGSVVRDAKGTFSDGPYAETKDVVAGYTIVNAKDLADARQIAAGCPILHGGGSVEVRPIVQL